MILLNIYYLVKKMGGNEGFYIQHTAKYEWVRNCKIKKKKKKRRRKYTICSLFSKEFLFSLHFCSFIGKAASITIDTPKAPADYNYKQCMP